MDVGSLRLRAAMLALLAILAAPGQAALAREQPAGATQAAPDIPEPLDEDELEVLVARIALYPDELVALISEASLYPLQIVEASRFLDQVAKKPGLKPKDSWDGSVISLLNYPLILTMMSEDLDWTQTFGEALTYQQKAVLVAIQQLRDKAVASGVLKTDDKMKVVEQNDNVVIQSVSAEKIYIPQYQPEMLYAAGYPVSPIVYYPDIYPNYIYPAAPYFAAFVTGAIWGAAMDWDNWGVWGGRWDGNDIDIDCNNCFNNISGKINLNDVDWKNVDRTKMNFDRVARIDNAEIRDRVRSNDRNSLRDKTSGVKRGAAALPAKAGTVKDVRRRQIEDGLKSKSGKVAADRPVAEKTRGASVANNRRAGPAKVNREVGKPRPAMKQDKRPAKPSALGSMGSGKKQKIASERGARSMGGGMRGGGQSVKRGGGQRPIVRGGRRR